MKFLEENIRSNLTDMDLRDVFVDLTPKAREANAKHKQMGLHQTKKLLHSKENHHQNEKAGFPSGAVVENLPANAGDTGSSPGLGRSHMPRSD